MIETICIKRVASFDETGITLNNLQKINFIYGTNGSGKTTITRLLANPTESKFSESTVKWEADIPVRPLVYNKDFRDLNFGRGEIDGVFTLGQATKEELDKIHQLEVQLNDLFEGIKSREGTLSNVREKLQLLEDDFTNNAWVEIYKKYETVFKEAFVGVMNKKEALKVKLLSEFKSNNSILSTYDSLLNRAKTIFGQKPIEIQPIIKPNFQRLLEIETDAIWAKKIIGKADLDIAKIIQDLNINDWVNEGRKYIKSDDTCPFCQQKTINDTFRLQLDAYFDATFTMDINYAYSLANEYNTVSSTIIALLNTIENNEKENADSKIDLDKFSAYIKAMLSLIVTNKELISNKVKEPSRNISLQPVNSQCDLILNVIDNANALIERHNIIVNNFDQEKSMLINEIWRFLSNEYEARINQYTKKANGSQKGISLLNGQITQLRNDKNSLQNQIMEATRNITSIQPSIDEINQSLVSFGFNNFHIVRASNEKNYYQIQREDGSLAESTLSEGEITFITFLYFIQLCKGSIRQETVNEQRILVVDDPISSLDSTILFVVSSLIKEIVKQIKAGNTNIKQMIILTHNVYFHKEVTFIDGRTKENGETKFWIIRKNGLYSVIQDYGTKNPINTSYELLWKELQNPQNSGITIQNTMRRILENYFNILGSKRENKIIDTFTTVAEKEICRSLLSWINDGSHSIPDDLYIEHSNEALEKYEVVFRKIFEQSGHIAHYNMMMGTE